MWKLRKVRNNNSKFFPPFSFSSFSLCKTKHFFLLLFQMGTWPFRFNHIQRNNINFYCICRLQKRIIISISRMIPIFLFVVALLCFFLHNSNAMQTNEFWFYSKVNKNKNAWKMGSFVIFNALIPTTTISFQSQNFKNGFRMYKISHILVEKIIMKKLQLMLCDLY